MSLFTVHTTATVLVAETTVPDNPLQLIVMFLLGVGVDLDHPICQREKFFFALRNMKRWDFFGAWRDSKHIPQKGTNWLHSWPFGLVLGIITVGLHLSPLPFIAFSVHMIVDGFYFFESPEFRQRSWLEAPVLIRRIIYKIYILSHTKGAH